MRKSDSGWKLEEAKNRFFLEPLNFSLWLCRILGFRALEL